MLPSLRTTSLAHAPDRHNPGYRQYDTLYCQYGRSGITLGIGTAVQRLLKVFSTARYRLTTGTEGEGTDRVTALQVAVRNSTVLKVSAPDSLSRASVFRLSPLWSGCLSSFTFARQLSFVFHCRQTAVFRYTYCLSPFINPFYVSPLFGAFVPFCPPPITRFTLAILSHLAGNCRRPCWLSCGARLRASVGGLLIWRTTTRPSTPKS